MEKPLAITLDDDAIESTYDRYAGDNVLTVGFNDASLMF